MAAGTEPLSAAGLAAAIEASVRVVSDGDKPVSVGNLRSLVDAGKLGGADVLFDGTPASRVTLRSPIDGYGVIACVVRDRYDRTYYMIGSSATFKRSGTRNQSGYLYTMVAPIDDSNTTGQQTANSYLMPVFSGTSMDMGSTTIVVVKVVGIK